MEHVDFSTVSFYGCSVKDVSITALTFVDDADPRQKSSDDEDEVVGPFEGDTATTEVRFVPADKGACKYIAIKAESIVKLFFFDFYIISSKF